MCDICKAREAGMSQDEAMSQYAQNMWDTIQLYGIGLNGVDDAEPPFVYTVGRTLDQHPELIINGYMPMNYHATILNAVHQKETLLRPGQVLDGYLSSGYKLKVLRADPVKAQMNLARGMFDSVGGITALQLVWPDPAGIFPDEDGYSTDERYTQPLYPVN